MTLLKVRLLKLKCLSTEKRSLVSIRVLQLLSRERKASTGANKTNHPSHWSNQSSNNNLLLIKSIRSKSSFWPKMKKINLKKRAWMLISLLLNRVKRSRTKLFTNRSKPFKTSWRSIHRILPQQQKKRFFSVKSLGSRPSNLITLRKYLLNSNLWSSGTIWNLKNRIQLLTYRWEQTE